MAKTPPPSPADSPPAEDQPAFKSLASYKHCLTRLHAAWPDFLAKREDRMRQAVRHGVAAEKVAEAILEDLFTEVLNWSSGDLDYQVDYADIVLTHNLVKYLLIEVKRPGALAWNRKAVTAALDQARRYADAQKVNCVGVSDGTMLYIADVEHSGLKDRLLVGLAATQIPEALWWASVHGIYRPCEETVGSKLRDLEPPHPASVSAVTIDGVLLHHKYQLPASCFGYVGNAAAPTTWKLPYLFGSGEPDEKRLPKAIQAVISNYRGTKVGGIPEPAIPDVLVRLGQAARRLGKLPSQDPDTASVYHQLVKHWTRWVASRT